MIRIKLKQNPTHPCCVDSCGWALPHEPTYKPRLRCVACCGLQPATTFHNKQAITVLYWVSVLSVFNAQCTVLATTLLVVSSSTSDSVFPSLVSLRVYMRPVGVGRTLSSTGVVMKSEKRKPPPSRPVHRSSPPCDFHNQHGFHSILRQYNVVSQVFNN